MDKTVLNIVKEIELQKNYLGNEQVQTIYFGGGTPSLLEVNSIKLLLSTVFNNFNVSATAEITLEANPDDLNFQFLHAIHSIGINRLSIGIQSFNDSDLKTLNRRHSSAQAIETVNLAKSLGFNNISIDLIYGLDFSSDETFKDNVQQAIELDVEHISAYHLTIEEKTKFYKLLEKGELFVIDEDRSNLQLKYLVEKLEKAGFLHYEISNFAKPHLLSKHNTNYWKQVAYLGVGPAAHSYNGISRQWNIANLRKYNIALSKGSLFFEKETLTDTDVFNDYLITSLRTYWGVDINYIKKNFPTKYYQHFISKSKKFTDSKHLIYSEPNFTIAKESIFLTDYLCSELLYV